MKTLFNFNFFLGLSSGFGTTLSNFTVSTPSLSSASILSVFSSSGSSSAL